MNDQRWQCGAGYDIQAGAGQQELILFPVFVRDLLLSAKPVAEGLLTAFLLTGFL